MSEFALDLIAALLKESGISSIMGATQQTDGQQQAALVTMAQQMLRTVLDAKSPMEQIELHRRLAQTLDPHSSQLVHKFTHYNPRHHRPQPPHNHSPARVH